MIEMDSNHCQIVGKSMTGERTIDEQTFASLEILGERLEHVRELDKTFESIAFSGDVMELKAQNNTVAVR